jgi:hypothetical protein
VNSGFIQKRRGILDHLRDGRLTLLELGAHDVVILLADKSTGLWTGSAKALAANCGAGDITDRQARHLLESLEKKGYIRRFPKRRSHANYPILVNRYLVTFGAYSGMTLNASATSDWRKPVYESRQEQGAERGVEEGVQRGAERAPIQEVRMRPEKKNKSTPAPETGAIAIVLPDWLPLSTWNDFLEMRKAKLKSPTRRAVELLLRKLAKLREAGEDVREVLEQSTLNSWQDVFPVRKENGYDTRQTTSREQQRHERSQQAVENVLGHRSGLADRLREGIPGGDQRGTGAALLRDVERPAARSAAQGVSGSGKEIEIQADAGRG